MTLTPRETEILQLVCDGHPAKVIAGKLGISAATVDCHKENIRGKLGAYGKTNEWLGVQAVKLGLIK
jgi:two-component system response regulator FixJ